MPQDLWISSVTWIRGARFWEVARALGGHLTADTYVLADLVAAGDVLETSEFLVLQPRTDELLLVEVFDLYGVWGADRLADGSELYVSLFHDGMGPSDVLVARDGTVVRWFDRAQPEEQSHEPRHREPLPEEADLWVGDGSDADGLVLLERLSGFTLTRELLTQTPGRVVIFDEAAQSRLCGFEPSPEPLEPAHPPRRRWRERRAWPSLGATVLAASTLESDLRVATQAWTASGTAPGRCSTTSKTYASASPRAAARRAPASGPRSQTPVRAFPPAP
jgi:hypothetical protein